MKKIGIISLLILSYSVLLNGCVQQTWKHNTKNKQQFYQDKIACRKIAARSIPNIHTTYRQPTSYSYNLQSNGFGRYSGNIRPIRTGGGFLAGVAAADAAFPQDTYQATLIDCMKSKGWYLQ